MAGWPSASLRPPRTWRPRSRRRGKGANGGRSSGFPCGADGSRGSGAPLPFPSSSRCCPRFFCERREWISPKIFGVGPSEPVPGKRLPPPDPRSGNAAEAKARLKRLRGTGALPNVLVKGDLLRGKFAGAAPRGISEAMRPRIWISSSQLCSSRSRSQISAESWSAVAPCLTGVLADRVADQIGRQRVCRQTLAGVSRHPLGVTALHRSATIVVIFQVWNI
jgi:hypothetical protein